MSGPADLTSPLVRPGKVAVVTGAASGIGRGLAGALGARGVRVVLADVEQGALAQAEAELTAAGAEVMAVATDISDGASVDALAEQVRGRWGEVAVVCANAGVITAQQRIWEQSEADWNWTVAVNLLGAANTMRAFVPAMVRSGRGHVVFTASIAGLTPLPGGGNGAYSASKFGIVGLAETLREELDEQAPDVGVTVLCPGPVPTRLHEAARNRPSSGGAAGGTAATAPTPRFGLGMETVSPEATAQAVLAGIDRRIFYLVPGSGTAVFARQRAERMRAELRAD